MPLFFFIVGVLQAILLLALARGGAGLAEKVARDRDLAKHTPRDGWPAVGLVVPVGGVNSLTEPGLRSLLEQDYPDLTVRLVTQTNIEPAAALASRLAAEYPRTAHIVAGPAERCGQKNHNLLAGIATLPPRTQVFAFADSTHVARADFLRCLIDPIARGETAFATGYREVAPATDSVATLGYALSVLFMRLLQSIGALTQPWGGALAMKKTAFARYEVAELWATNVVDDCSLAAWLKKKGAHVRLAAGALLETKIADYRFATWAAWLDRQILFLKFCMPGQWLGLGALCFLMIAPSVWGFWAMARGLLGVGGGTAPFLALCWLLCVAWAVYGLRKLLPRQPASARWLTAFFCACAMFAASYARTIFADGILWGNIRYTVGKGGEVLKILRLPPPRELPAGERK